MSKRHEKYLSGLYEYIHKLAYKAREENKDFIIWGYAKGGAFIKWLLENDEINTDIAYIIDDKMDFVINGSPAIYRSSLFEYIDNDKYIVLSTIIQFDDVRTKLMEYGYVAGDNLYNARKDLGVSYVDYLQISNDLLDFSNTTEKDYPTIYTGTENYISTPFDTISVDMVFDEVKKLEPEVFFFDYGCGKGQILFDAYINGIDNLAGIELVETIAKSARNNLSILDIPAEIICEDATTYRDIDKYNVFYFFNPFGGSTFKKVMRNIEDSWYNNPRRIHIVYMNPTCHKSVIEDKVFSLDKQLYVACGDPLANFYVTSDGED